MFWFFLQLWNSLVYVWRHCRFFLFSLDSQFVRLKPCVVDEVLSAVRLCVPGSLLRWQGILSPGFHFDTTSPLRFVLPSMLFFIQTLFYRRGWGTTFSLLGQPVSLLEGFSAEAGLGPRPYVLPAGTPVVFLRGFVPVLLGIHL